jgi:hypothetical protein
MTARQNDTAVIDFGRSHAANLRFRQSGALSQGTAAGRTPIRFQVDGEDGVAVGANPFHEARLLEAAWIRRIRKA